MVGSQGDPTKCRSARGIYLDGTTNIAMSDLPTIARPANPARYQAQSSRFKFLPHYIPPQELRERQFYDRVRPLLDWALAAFITIPALPIVLVAAIIVKLTSRGPALYTQTRLGRHGQPYKLVKIRTMYRDSERLTGPVWARPGDRRITRVG